MKQNNPIIYFSFLLILFLFNTPFIYAQDKSKVKKEIRVSHEFHSSGVRVDTSITNYNEFGFDISPGYGAYVIHTIKIDTIKIDNDTVWEQHIKRYRLGDSLFIHKKYHSLDTSITIIFNPEYQSLTIEKEFKAGFRKKLYTITPLSPYSYSRTSYQEFLLDKSNPFVVKNFSKYKRGEKSYIESKIVTYKWNNTFKFFSHSFKKEKLLKRQKLKRRKDNIVKKQISYYERKRFTILNLFSIDEIHKYSYNKKGQLIQKKYSDGYFIKPYEEIYYEYDEKGQLILKKFYDVDDAEFSRIVYYYYEYYD